MLYLRCDRRCWKLDGIMKRLDVDSPCPGCGYNLRGLPQRYQCPECGHFYDLSPRPASHASVDPALMPRLNAFDKACAYLALLFAAFFVLFGLPGFFLGCKLWLELPAILGVLPALAGWGIFRTFWIASRADDAAQKLAALSRKTHARPKPYIPPIYRDPVPGDGVERLDWELARQMNDLHPDSIDDVHAQSLHAIELDDEIAPQVVAMHPDFVEHPADEHYNSGHA